MLTKYAGKTIAETPFADAQSPEKLALARVTVVNDANGQQRNKLYPLQVGFKKYGKSGIEVSATGCRTPASASTTSRCIRSMWTTDDNHGAQTQFHTGRHMLDGEFPTLGAWVHYGLGSLNDNLPQFVSMGNREYWNIKDGHYLGPAHDAVPMRVDPANPLDYGKPEVPVTAAEQKAGFELSGKLNKLRAKRVPRRRGARRPHQELRTRVPDAEVAAGGARLRARRRRRRRSCTASTEPRRGRSGSSCSRPAGWWSAGCGSSRFSTGPAARACGTPTAG